MIQSIDDKPMSVLVTGGAGYVGSALVPKLLSQGHKVTVLDLYLYGEDVLQEVEGHPNLRQVKGDIRDIDAVQDALQGCDAVIHLACISNDPSFELDPTLGKSINLDAFGPLVRVSKQSGVKRFVYASSSSVYGVKTEPRVTEDLPLHPLTDYSKFKALCEQELNREREPGFVTCTIRPSTVCGYAPRQRLDVIVNILTNHAINRGRIRVFGGSQKRPNIHIDDMVDLYVFLLKQPSEKIDGKTYNAGDENRTLMELAEIVKKVVGDDLPIDVESTNDPRSYHVSSGKLFQELGYKTIRTIEDAVRDLAAAFKEGKLPNSMDDPCYFNVKQMQRIQLK